MTMPAGAIIKKRVDRPVTPEPQPTTTNGKLLGRPRADARVLDVLQEKGDLMTVAEIAERLNISLDAAHNAVYRAQLRGLIERQYGYRVKAQP